MIPRALVALVAAFAAGALAQQPGTVWRLSPQPLISIGGPGGPPGELISQIAGAVRLPDGRFVIADRQEVRVSVYDASGRLQTAFGRNGEGPGEFRYIGDFWVAGGDTIAVWDRDLQRISRFRPDGRLIRSDRLQAGPAGAPGRRDGVYGRLRDGRVVLSSLEFGPRGADGLQPDRMTFGIVDRDGRFQGDVTTQNGMHRQRTATGGGPHPFSPWPWAAVVRDTLVFTTGVRGEIVFFDPARPGDPPARTIGVTGPAISLADAWESLEPALESSVLHVSIVERARTTDRSIGIVPRFARMFADDAGRLWLKDYDPPTDATVVRTSNLVGGGRWRIVETDARPVATIVMPAGVAPIAVHGDQMLAVARDALDVETFVVYRIVR